MPKPRSKRQAIREERKRKKHDRAFEDDESSKPAKRQRLGNEDDAYETNDAAVNDDAFASGVAPEREFFGMLSDQEQEYFRAVDEQLDIDDFPSQEERDLYLANVFVEAQGKELKLACSQSCSRLMERLILMSNTRQKKKLFEQFATHFLGLIQHRFASHCCETLFLQSAPIVTRELRGERDDQDEDGSTPPTMEELFLLTLDELDGHLGYLLTDKFASHTLRVLLIILSGRPLEQTSTKSLMHSKKKEQISAPWTSQNNESNDQLRANPSTFTMAAKKIIADSTSGMDATALRVLATHPTGNPVLQLLLELDIALNLKSGDESGEMTLLWRLLPGAPASLKESNTPATEFINAMLYDPIGSRLLETLLVQCPGKLFKALWKFNLSDRIQSLVRNDIASYPAMRILNRLSKEDLVASIHKILPELPKLVSLSRLSVIRLLFERCQAREATAEINNLLRALIKAYGSDPKALVPKLCMPDLEEGEEKSQESLLKSRAALVSGGSYLVTTLLSIGGAPASAVQTSLAAISPEDLLKLATSSGPTSHVLLAAFTSPAQNKIFHKVLVASLMRNTMDLARSEHGAKVLSSIIYIPSRSDGINLPFHLKEQILGQLVQNESELRESYEGRKVWKAWKVDQWRTRRVEWITWAKDMDSKSDQTVLPWQKKTQASSGQGNANMVKIDESARYRRENKEGK